MLAAVQTVEHRKEQRRKGKFTELLKTPLAIPKARVTWHLDLHSVGTKQAPTTPKFEGATEHWME